MGGKGRCEVFLVTPGGLAQRGGMGRVMANLVAAWPSGRADAPAWRIVDPWPAEWRLRFSPLAPLAFARALLVIVAARLAGRLGFLHLHMASRGSVVRKGLLVWLGWAMGVPVIVHSAAADLDTFWAKLPGPARILLRHTLRRARFVVVLGAYWREFFVRTVGLEPSKVSVIPNGVPDPGEPPARPAGKPCRLLFLGRLGRRKGTPLVIDALADPRLKAMDWTITFAGDGEVEAMRERAVASGIAERATFLGWVGDDRLPGLLARSDILLLPSRQEGLPMAILEAMAHGLAIVATGAGAIEDAITDGETGLLVPIGDVPALADAVLRLLAEPGLRERLQAAARSRYLAEYRSETMAARFAALYRTAGLEPTAGAGAPSAPAPAARADAR